MSLLFTKWISIAGFNADRFGYNGAEVMLRDLHPKGHTYGYIDSIEIFVLPPSLVLTEQF